jgi:predicted lipoprotein with Yx(FWY)xxD motif
VRVIRVHRWTYTVCGAAVALALGTWGIQAAVRPPLGGVNRAHTAPLPGTATASAAGAVAYGDQAGVVPSDPATAPANPGVNPAPPMPAGNPAAQLVSRTVADLGAVVTDGGGFALYRFDRDTANPSAATCVDACVTTWQPVLTGGAPGLQGIDTTLVGTVTRADGGVQVTLAGWPLYRYTGDRQPGTVTGQGADGAWWAVAPTGRKVLAQPTTPSPVTPTTPPVDGGIDRAPLHW